MNNIQNIHYIHNNVQKKIKLHTPKKLYILNLGILFYIPPAQQSKYI